MMIYLPLVGEATLSGMQHHSPSRKSSGAAAAIVEFAAVAVAHGGILQIQW